MKLSHTLVFFKYLVWSLKNKIIKYPKLWSCQSLWSQNRGPRNTKGQQLRIGPSEKTKRDTNTKNRLWEEYPHTPPPHHSHSPPSHIALSLCRLRPSRSHTLQCIGGRHWELNWICSQRWNFSLAACPLPSSRRCEEKIKTQKAK